MSMQTLAICAQVGGSVVQMASGSPLNISAPLTADAPLTFAHEQGTARAQIWAADGLTDAPTGWINDGDPRSGQVALQISGLYLSAGVWEITLGSCSAQIEVRSDPTDVRDVREGVGPLMGLRKSDDGLEVAVALPARGVPLGAGWDLMDLGSPTPRTTRTASESAPVRLEPVARRTPNQRSDQDDWIQWALFPVSVLTGLAGLSALRRPARPSHLIWWIVAMMISATVATGGAWLTSTTTLLQTQGPINDPTDSIAMLAALMDAVPKLSATTTRFASPEGVPWTASGPSWLAYLLSLPAAFLWGPVRAQTLGMALGAALLALTTGLLARARGARISLAASAGLLAALTPAIVDEWDAVSLDRSCLWVAPLVALALHRVGDRASTALDQARAACALGAALLAQIYYGVLIALTLPVAACFRWRPSLDRSFPRRMLLTGVLATVLTGPILGTLSAGTADTPYAATASMSARFDAVTTRLTNAEATSIAASGRNADGFRDFDLSTARSRVLAAGSMSLSLEEVVNPDRWLPGGWLAWPALLIAVVVAPRRREALAGLVEVTLLFGLSLGPFLWVSGSPGAGLTPWGLVAIIVPGFDQLKNVDRAALLASTLAPAVLALGAEGVCRQLESLRGQRAGSLAAAVITTMAIIGVGGLRIADGTLIRRGTPVRVQHLSSSPLLDAIPDGALISLPLAGPVRSEQALPLLHSGFSLVNQPPFEVPRDDMYIWADDSALLSRLAMLSRDPQLTRPLSARDYGHDVAELRAGGVVGVVLHRSRMPGPATVRAAGDLLNQTMDFVGRDGDIMVWRMPDSAAR